MLTKPIIANTGLPRQPRLPRVRAGPGDHRRPLASVALDLGFSSQSHFTRLFSSLTGMTPAKYRKQFRPVTA
ncbi:MAG: helix-turn-helix transcriptional regulator [Planctomycetes bacterium]|nr:helix-turn-helix transcriptional regulator [Planctomycetota bacterium]